MSQSSLRRRSISSNLASLGGSPQDPVPGRGKKESRIGELLNTLEFIEFPDPRPGGDFGPCGVELTHRELTGLLMMNSVSVSITIEDARRCIESER